MSGNGTVVLPKVVAGLSGEAGELLSDHREQPVQDEVGVHSCPWALATTQEGHMVPPRVINLVER